MLDPAQGWAHGKVVALHYREEPGLGLEGGEGEDWAQCEVSLLGGVKGDQRTGKNTGVSQIDGGKLYPFSNNGSGP